MMQQMLKLHPRSSEVDIEELSDTIMSIYTCAASCNICADACLAEEDVGGLADCIRMTLHCAQSCSTTGDVLSRITETDRDALSAQVNACIAMCEACAKECGKHAEKYEHCQACGYLCKECAARCSDFLRQRAASPA